MYVRIKIFALIYISYSRLIQLLCLHQDPKIRWIDYRYPVLFHSFNISFCSFSNFADVVQYSEFLWFLSFLILSILVFPKIPHKNCISAAWSLLISLVVYVQVSLNWKANDPEKDLVQGENLMMRFPMGESSKKKQIIE